MIIINIYIFLQNKGAIKTGSTATVQATKEKSSVDVKANSETNYLTHLTSLTNAGSRTVRTRRLAQAQDDPELNKTAKLAKVNFNKQNLMIRSCFGESILRLFYST